jgi:O-antigen ligase
MSDLDSLPQDQAPGPDRTLVWLFCAMVFALCFNYQEAGALRWLNWNLGISLTPDRIAFCVLLLVYAARPVAAKLRSGNLAKSAPTAARRLERFMFAFSFFGAASYLVFGGDEGNGRLAELTRLAAISIIPSASYFVARRLQYTRADIKKIVWFFAALGVYLGFTGIFEHYEITSLVFPKYILDRSVGIHFERSRGPFVDAIADGGIMVVSFVILIYASSSLKGFKRVFLVFMGLVILQGIYFTDTRANWLAFAGIVVTLFAARTPMRKAITVFGWLILLGFLTGVTGRLSLYQETLFSRRPGSVDYRWDNYEAAWNMFKENPLFGLGYGRFQREVSEYSARLGIKEDLARGGNHSTMLGILAELGLTGLTLYVGVLMSAAIVCRNALRRLRDDRWAFEKTFAVVGLCALVSYFILGLTNDLRAQPAVNVSTFWLLGIASSMSSQSQESKSDLGEKET